MELYWADVLATGPTLSQFLLCVGLPRKTVPNVFAHCNRTCQSLDYNQLTIDIGGLKVIGLSLFFQYCCYPLKV